MYDVGLVNYLHTKYKYPPQKQCRETMRVQRIELLHVQTMFTVISYLMLLATLLLIIEYLKHKFSVNFTLRLPKCVKRLYSPHIV